MNGGYGSIENGEQSEQYQPLAEWLKDETVPSSNLSYFSISISNLSYLYLSVYNLFFRQGSIGLVTEEVKESAQCVYFLLDSLERRQSLP